MIKKRLVAFKYAWNGLLEAFKDNLPLRIHFIATLAVVVLGTILSVSVLEWFVLLFVITLVIVAELFNTSIERLCDTLHPERSEGIRLVKDISAGAVLATVILAVVIGAIIFIPYIYK